MKKLLIIPLIFIAAYVSGQVKKAEIVNLNEGSIYYETYGEGEPLFFLHGYTQSSKYWLPYSFEFINDYQIYLVDLPEHGKSSQLPKDDLSFDEIVSQLNELVNKLELTKIKAIGFSFGGDVLFHWSSNNPDLIESMVTIGSLPRNISEDFPGMTDYLSYKNKELFPWMPAYHQSEAQIKRILNLFRNYDSSLNNDELSRIKTKILMVYGDNDEGIPLNEVTRVRKIIPNTDLMILPNSGHEAHEGKNFELFLKKSLSFLKGE